MYINSWYRRVIRYASISIAALIVIQMMAVTHIDIYLENKIQSEVEALSKQNEKWKMAWKSFSENSADFALTEAAILERTENCSNYLDNMPVLTALPVLTDLENQLLFRQPKHKDASTPMMMGYNIMVHSQPAIFEIFLAVYYRPYDYYVIHLDQKASNETRNVFSQVIGCYSEKTTTGKIVLIPQNESISIEWGTKSILEANLINYKKLLTFNQNSTNRKWSHAIAIAGSELPTMPYSIFRENIRAHLNENQSSLESFPLPPGNYFRVTEKMKKNCFDSKCDSTPWRFKLPNPMKKNTSYTFQVFKGTHINAVLSAKDVDFLINSPISKEYFNWVENMEMSAEESYQSTLLRLSTNPMQNILQDVDGSMEDYYRGVCPKYVNWYDGAGVICKGQWIRTVCNFGVGDLPRVQSSGCLFGNKFNLEVDKYAVLKHYLYLIELSLNETISSTVSSTEIYSGSV